MDAHPTATVTLNTGVKVEFKHISEAPAQPNVKKFTGEHDHEMGRIRIWAIDGKLYYERIEG